MLRKISGKFILFFLFPFIFSGYSLAQTCPVEMSHYWMLDDTSAPYYDLCNGSNTTCTNCPTYALDGKIEGAQQFDGIDDEVNVADDDTFDWAADDSFSIELWMKTSATGGGTSVMVGRDDTASTALHWWVGHDSSFDAAFVLWDTNGEGPVIVDTGNPLNDDQWHHIVAVRNEGDDTNRLYVDGNLAGEEGYNYDLAYGFGSAVELNIGYINVRDHYRYNGMLDEVALWNKALTETEIRTHYFLGRGYVEECDTPVKIMPLGDSITRGSSSGTLIGDEYYISYRKDLWESLSAGGYDIDFVGSRTAGNFYSPPFDPNYEGFGGKSADEIRDGIYDWLTATPADVILLHIGTVDIFDGEAPEDIWIEVEEILDEIDLYEAASETDVTVILARIINVSYHMCPDASTTTTFNNYVQSMAETRIANGDRIIIVDMECGAGIDYELQPFGDMYDPLHPYHTGHTKISTVWYDDALTTFLPVCTEPVLIPPEITSSPATDALVGLLYTYPVEATGYPAPTFTLTQKPGGMTINTDTGLVQWTPTAVGDYDVIVNASNGVNPDATQPFTITVSDITGSIPTQDYLIFDGSNDFVEVADDDNLDLDGGSFTISAWINPTSWGQNNQGRIIDHGGGSSGNLGWSLHLQNHSAGTEALMFQINNAATFNRQSDSNIIALNLWQHVAVTYDSGTLIFYVNGVESGVRTGVPIPAKRVAPVRIGIRATDFYRAFQGSIDEVRIWNRALPQGELQANMNVELSGDEPGLVAYYNFNEGSGQTAYDYTTNQNNGTLGSTISVDVNDPVWFTSVDLCGNDQIDPGEDCDGIDLNSMTCLDLGYDGGLLACDAFCQFDETGCTVDLCGNDQIDPGEDCDGIDLNSTTCLDLGYDGGLLTCDAFCQFDETGCTVDLCGNDQIDPGEDCDGIDLNSMTCLDLGYDGGLLTCDAFCQFDETGCTVDLCGNDQIDPGEDCDGIDLNSTTCLDLGYDGGLLTCDAFCQFDETGCTVDLCGNDQIDPGEDCDGIDLNSTTCLDLGYDGGLLACDAFCQFDETGCTVTGSIPTQDYLIFDGSNDFVEVVDDDNLDLDGGSFTISAWINPTSWGQNNQGRIIDHGGGSSGNLGWSLHLQNQNAGTEALMFQINNAATFNRQSDSNIIALNLWQHVAVTYDSGTLIFYVNGVESGVRTSVPIPAKRVAPVRIGIRATDFYRAFQGSIDEVRIWNRALPQGELQANMNVELSGDEPGLVAYYNFNEGFGQTAYDYTTNQNNGTLGPTISVDVNDPTWVTSIDLCGNDQIDPGEDCDGIDLNSMTCLDLGYDGGLLTCDAFCQFDETGCTVDLCGNDQIDPGEDCDGTDLNSMTCLDLGYDGGLLTCDAFCQFDETGCTVDLCGNDQIDPGEDCDGIDLNSMTCLDLGYDGGLLACDAFCQFDETGCTVDLCGNDQIDPGEDCDGTDLNSMTCLDLGYDGGLLTCDAFCQFDETGCTVTGSIPTQDYLIFDGSNDFVEVVDDDNLDLDGGSFTISAWINPTSWGQNNQGRIIDHGGGSSGNLGWSLHLQNQNAGTEALMFQINNAATFNRQSDSNIIALNLWQHVAVTYDSGTLIFYVNGVESGVRTSVPIPAKRVAPVRIGIRATDFYRAFQGSIDEVRIWNRALPQGELQANMNVELLGDEPGLVAYYNFNEGFGQTAYDYTTNQNNGTLGSTISVDVNDPTWVK